MSKQLCIAALQFIEVDEALGRGDRFADDIFVTNDTEVIRQHLTADMALAFGRLEMNAIASAKLVAYRVVETVDGGIDVADVALLSFLHELNKLMLALWIVKANAVSFENAFLSWPLSGGMVVTSKNYWDGAYSNASGEQTGTKFSRTELRAARKIHERLWRPSSPAEHVAGEPTKPDLPRLSRALYFLQAARHAAALSMKVAFYCSAFESLLSTDSSELSHKLAERVAWIIAQNAETRLEVFRRLKAAYSIRSHAIHGSQISQKKQAQELRAASEDCDANLRSLFASIITSPVLRHLYIETEATRDELEAALVRLCLDPTR